MTFISSFLTILCIILLMLLLNYIFCLYYGIFFTISLLSFKNVYFFFFFQLVIKPNVIKKANGSAYYEAENIKIICGV